MTKNNMIECPNCSFHVAVHTDHMEKVASRVADHKVATGHDIQVPSTGDDNDGYHHVIVEGKKMASKDPKDVFDPGKWDDKTFPTPVAHNNNVDFKIDTDDGPPSVNLPGKAEFLTVNWDRLRNKGKKASDVFKQLEEQLYDFNGDDDDD